MVEGGHSTVSPRSRQLNKSGSSKRRTIDNNLIEKNVNDLLSSDLSSIAKALKRASVSSLHLFQKHAELQKRISENRKLGFLGDRHSETLYTFSKNLAWSLSSGGSLQELELGFTLWDRDLKIIAESICQSPTLKKLSFANSELGDHGLQILGKSLQECAQLEVLNLSACGLTDAVSALLAAILKAHVCRRTQGDWQASLRCTKGVNALTMRRKGLTALDISLNRLSDFSVQTICTVLRIGTPLECLNLRGNQLTRLSGKLLLDIMEEWATLRLIDLRDNTDNKLMGVLEDRQHLTTFTRRYPPFWNASGKPTKHRTFSKQTRGLADSNVPINPLTRPQSCPNIAQSPHRPKSRCGNPTLLLRESAPRHPGQHTKDDSRHGGQRPSTSPTKEYLSLSSCSPPEFAAWEDNDSCTKENRMPFDISTGVNTTLAEGSKWKQSMQNKISWTQKLKKAKDEEVDALQATDLRRNLESRNYQGENFRAREGSTSRLKEVQRPEQHSGENTFDENHGLDQEFEQRCVKDPGRQTASFLKEITHTILHLQKRLDEIIGTQPDSLAEEVASQLKVFD